MSVSAYSVPVHIMGLISAFSRPFSFRLFQPIVAALMLLTTFAVVSPTNAMAVDDKAVDIDLKGWTRDIYVKVVMQYYTVTVSGTTQIKTNYTVSKIVTISQLPATLGTGIWTTIIPENALGFSVKATGVESGDADLPKTWTDGFYDEETGITTFYLTDPKVMGNGPIHAPG